MAKLLVIVLLLVSSLSPLLMSQLVPYQTASTETNTIFVTSTGSEFSQAVVTSTMTQPLRFVGAPATYNNQANSFLLDQAKVKVHGHVLNLAKNSPHIEIDVYTCLYYEYFVYDAVASQQVFLHFDAPKIISFYIMSPRQLDYVDSYACNNGSWPAPVRTVASSSDLNWTAPQSGQYAFVFAGREVYPVRFTAYTLNTAIQSTTRTYATTTTFAIQNIETTMLAQSSSVSSAPSSESLVLTVAAVAAVLILGLVAIIIRRGSGRVKPL